MEAQLNFDQSVIERSWKIPVLVDFWAPWCGPCKVLSPVIEQLAKEQSDRWELVKVNTEEYQDLAREYRIMSIPNVKLFHRGEVVAEFSGALPRASIIRWLNEHIPDDRKEELDRILQEIETNDVINPETLEVFVQQNPGFQEGRLALARLLVIANPKRAQELIEDIRLGNPLFEQAEDIRLLSELNDIQANGEPVAAALIQAREALTQEDSETAIQAVINAVNIDKSFRDDLPRRLAIALFRAWGPQHELTRQYRRKFDMALY